MAVIFEDLKGKHVLITGGTGGIGGGVSPAFAQQGSRVSILGRDAERGQGLADKCNAEGGDVHYYQVDVMDTDKLVDAACREIVRYTADRQPVLIFASGVKHGEHIASVLRDKHDAQVAAVFGETLPGFRDQALEDFRAGQLKYLLNVNVLTTGFDAPNIDCVAMVRPTMSPGL